MMLEYFGVLEQLARLHHFLIFLIADEKIIFAMHFARTYFARGDRHRHHDGFMRRGVFILLEQTARQRGFSSAGRGGEYEEDSLAFNAHGLACGGSTVTLVLTEFAM